MRRYFAILTCVLCCWSQARAAGLLIPEEKTIPPLALLDHHVKIRIVDQVAVTTVEQTFRNHTDRALEATYIFPVPRDASVRGFTMTVDGHQTKAELIEAAQATRIYTDIVLRTMDPGLLECMGHNLMRMKVFPVPARGDVKVTVNYTSVAKRDGGAVEYIYPLTTGGKATRTLEKFTIEATLESQHRLQNIYSPSHAIRIKRQSDHQAVVRFERNAALLGRDFQLFYDVGDKDVGLTALTHRPIRGENGFYLLLVSPRIELPQDQVIPRDMVLVLDTSGSMREGGKIEQARRALKYCLDHLGKQDRFALINFATTVNSYSDHLLPANSDQVTQARKWVDQLDANGGTAIDDALKAALALRSQDTGRTFTIVFFTDGCPTIGETDPQVILKHVAAQNTANTRIFTFGVGDDVNASLLDQLAEQSRAVSTYVRPAEDIEAKVTGLYAKISNPVLADLSLTVSGGVRMMEQYPPQLPDLFQGGQLVVLGRYSGQGHAAIRLAGTVGHDRREFVYETSFSEHTTDAKSFVEDLWARRKVGYLLDQIRAHGEKGELKDEVVRLAKHYGIATPYTSYLVAPDLPLPLASRTPISGRAGINGGFGGSGIGGGLGGGGWAPPALLAGALNGRQTTVADFAARAAQKPGGYGLSRGAYLDDEVRKAGKDDKGVRRLVEEAKQKREIYRHALEALQQKDRDGVQTGKLGVDLALQAGQLRTQTHLERTAQRLVAGRTCLEIGGVWIDDGFKPNAPSVTVRAMSDAYFRILALHPEMKSVYQLGNYLLWVTPSGTALIIDARDGKTSLTDAEIGKLFVTGK